MLLQQVSRSPVDLKDNLEQVPRTNMSQQNSRSVQRYKSLKHHNGQVFVHLNDLEVSYNEPRDVYCASELILLNIDLQSQIFDAEITIKLYWQQPELKKVLSKNRDFVIHDDGYSIPIDIDDPFESDLSLEWIEKEYSFSPKTNTVELLLHLKDQFTEKMELERFPVDRQFLNINLIRRNHWNWLTSAPEWVPEMYQKEQCQIQAKLGASVSDYKMFSPWADFLNYKCLKLRFRVQRYCGFYLGNIVIPLILIIICCFSSLAIPNNHDNIADRLSVTITLMLATVAFRFVLASLLPPVPYLTWMDYHIIFSFIVVALFIAENSIAANIQMHSTYNIDKIFGIFISVLLFIVNGFFIFAMCTDVFRYSWDEMDKQDRDNTEEHDEFVCANINNITRLDTKTQQNSSPTAIEINRATSTRL